MERERKGGCLFAVGKVVEVEEIGNFWCVSTGITRDFTCRDVLFESFSFFLSFEICDY